VELSAWLDSLGLVILADPYYPGWRLTFDGETEPIYRANRLMRASPVLAGEHTLCAIAVKNQIFLLTTDLVPRNNREDLCSIHL
jgi:hypothetical protein